MNCIYVISIVFCLAGWRSTGASGPLSEVLKAELDKWKTRGNMWQSKRAVFGMLQGTQRNMYGKSHTRRVHTGANDHCMMAMMCPSTEIVFPTGNIGAGLHFGEETLDSVCNYTTQYLECYDMLSGSFACGEMSTLMADVFNVLQDSVCHKPRTPEILSLLQCMNNRELQVTIFGEIQRLSGIATAYHEIGIPIEKQKSSLCRWQFSSFNGLMQHTRSICDGNVYETICDIRSRLDPYMDAMLAATTNDVECPKETFRCAA